MKSIGFHFTIPLHSTYDLVAKRANGLHSAMHVDSLRLYLGNYGNSVDLEATDHMGQTPLAVHCSANKLNCAIFLLTSGANAQAALVATVRTRSKLCLQALLVFDAKREALRQALNDRTILQLLSAGDNFTVAIWQMTNSQRSICQAARAENFYISCKRLRAVRRVYLRTYSPFFMAR